MKIVQHGNGHTTKQGSYFEWMELQSATSQVIIICIATTQYLEPVLPHNVWIAKCGNYPLRPAKDLAWNCKEWYIDPMYRGKIDQFVWKDNINNGKRLRKIATVVDTHLSETGSFNMMLSFVKNATAGKSNLAMQETRQQLSQSLAKALAVLSYEEVEKMTQEELIKLVQQS